MKIKKIGVITVVRTRNFGAELQAFALQRKLIQLGYNVEIIDYLYYKHKNHKTSAKSKPELYFSIPDKIKKYVLYHMILPVIDFFLPMFHKNYRLKALNFDRFNSTFIRFSQQFNNIESLYTFDHPYDVYITGSDQVWNPATYSSLKPYLLDFVKPNKLRIAYAASFGVSKVTEQFTQLYKPLFDNFNNIGVREASGKELLSVISHKVSEVVLDPTFLLEKKEWKDVAIEPETMNIQKPYIIVYDLHPSRELTNLAEQIGDSLKIPIYRICNRAFNNSKNRRIINIEDAGPSEFIYLFINATFVVTNSYHGTIFSCNFNKPFYVVLNPERKNNSRITGFLELIELTERIVWENNMPNKITCEVDFCIANNELSKWRLASINFLNSSINS